MLTLKSITLERSTMTDPNFGYEYPAGADSDPNAPFNEDYSDADYEDGEDIFDDDEGSKKVLRFRLLKSRT